MNPDDEATLMLKPWRTDTRQPGRAIYAQLHAEPSEYDQFVGIMDSRALAIEVCQAHNLALEGRYTP